MDVTLNSPPQKKSAAAACSQITLGYCHSSLTLLQHVIDVAVHFWCRNFGCKVANLVSKLKHLTESFVNMICFKHAHTQLFYGSLDSVQDNPGEPVSEETSTHSHLSWPLVIPYLLSPSITIHGIFLIQFTCLTVFIHNFSPSFLFLLAWHPQLHTPYISSPNHCLLSQDMPMPSQPVLLL